MTDDAKAKADLKSTGIGCAGLTLFPILLLAFCSSSDGPSIPEQPGDTAKEDAVAFYKSVISKGASCDSAFIAAGEALGSKDSVAAYRVVKAAKDQCLPVSSEIEGVEIPASVGKAAHEKLTEAKQTCANLYVNKWAAMNDVAEILDGAEGVARMAGVQDTLEKVPAGTMLCVARLMGPLVELEVDLDTIEVD